MSWFSRSKQPIQPSTPREMPEGLWTKCPSCNTVIYKRQLEEHLFTCHSCSHHFRVGPEEYIEILFDEGSFEYTNTNIRSKDVLQFVDTKPYAECKHTRKPRV